MVPTCSAGPHTEEMRIGCRKSYIRDRGNAWFSWSRSVTPALVLFPAGLLRPCLASKTLASSTCCVTAAPALCDICASGGRVAGGCACSQSCLPSCPWLPAGATATTTRKRAASHFLYNNSHPSHRFELHCSVCDVAFRVCTQFVPHQRVSSVSAGAPEPMAEGSLRNVGCTYHTD